MATPGYNDYVNRAANPAVNLLAESTDERILTELAVMASGQNPDGSPSPTFSNSGGFAWDVRLFGAKCDGGSSQTGTLSSLAVLTDATPSGILPLANQTFSWVGPGAAVGGGLTGVTQAAGTPTVTITTTSAHGLTTGTQVAIAGIVGCTEINGTWPITNTGTNTFTIPLNTFALSAVYSSGGTVTPTIVLSGFVSSPVVAAGTLTFTAVTTSGGATPITVPSGVGSTGAYYYCTDDTVAWNAAITAAENFSATQRKAVAITWTGVSGVSSTLNPIGNVLIWGQWMDYTNPDGSNSAGTLPQRGSILRAIATFANPTTTAVLQLGAGGANILSSGTVGTSTWGGVIDAANIACAAIKSVGARNWTNYTYGCNGTLRAFWWTGSNCVATECIAGQSNTGDGLYVNGTGDCKWKGGYIRQANNGVHLDGPNVYDFYIGNGAHVFSNYNSVPGQAGNNILISPTAGTPSFTQISDCIFGATQGYSIRLAPASGITLVNTLISGNSFEQVGIVNAQDKVWGFVQVDTTSTGVVSVCQVDGNIVYGTSGTARLKSIIDCVGAGTQTKVILGANSGSNCAAFYTGTSPNRISGECGVFNGAATVYSRFQGQLVCTGNAATTVYTIAHTLGIAPAAGSIQATLTATSSPVGFPATPGSPVFTGDATNIIATFASAPTSGSWTFNVLARIG